LHLIAHEGKPWRDQEDEMMIFGVYNPMPETSAAKRLKKLALITAPTKPTTKTTTTG